MQNIRPFQVVLLAVFAVVGVVSIFVLAQYEGLRGETEKLYGERVVIWGPFEKDVFESVLIDLRKDDKDLGVVQYVEKDPRTFENEMVNAIAEGNAPDVVLIPHEQLVAFRTKLLPIPYETMPERTFRDRYLDGAEIFARPDGVYAVPFAVDPLVMYWNRDLFSTNGISSVPTTWERLVSEVVPRITKRDNNRNLLTSAIAFGEYQNVLYAKEILLTLITQSGSRLVEELERGYKVSIDTPIVENTRNPMTAAVQFFVDFSNVNSSLYSWNKSSGSDRTAFLADNLGVFFAYGSEEPLIRRQNPNLNFDMAMVPQGASATIKRVYGTFYGFAIVRASQNPQGSYRAIMKITGDAPLAELTTELSLAPASRSLITQGAANPYRQTIFDSALYARGWLDPGPEESDEVFSVMIEDIVSSRERTTSAVTDAVRRLELAF